MSDAEAQVPTVAKAAAPDELPGAAPAARPWSVSRTLGRWRQVLRDIAAGARLSFVGGADPELSDDQAARLRTQMQECLEARGGEVLARAQAANIATAYLTLSPLGRRRFFAMLATEFGVERAAVDEAIEAYGRAADEPARLGAERALRRALVTPGMRLLTKFNGLPEGLRFLIDMRADLLAAKDDDPALTALDSDFRHLLATWFDIGFLSRRRLTWDSPASVLEKIVEYESVHEVRSWSDLRHRLDGDRRCYAFFHPSLPKEPVIFLQVALVEGLAGEIEPLLDERRPPLDPQRADSAIFYSITNTLLGLRGISFGNFLIKQVVDDLAHDLPNLRQFATLSPMPGFRRWLAAQDADAVFTKDEREQLGAVAPEGPWAALEHPDWLDRPELAELLEKPLTRAAARYLVARDDDGLPIDPVARFHLGNGARIERVNFAADRSPHRLAQSGGIMVNYLYHRPEIEPNHEAFARRREITLSPAIGELLKGLDDAHLERVRVRRRGGGLGRMIRRS